MKNKTRAIIITAMHDTGTDNPIAASLEVSNTDYVVCADGGYIFADKEGIIPDIVMGDFDSSSRAEIESAGIRTETFKSEKDDTDTMLAVKHSMGKGFDNIVIVGGIGGDFGHTIANIQALSYLTDMECEASILTSKEKIMMLDGETIKIVAGPLRSQKPPSELAITGVVGKKFSIFSYEERTTGVCIENAKYLLDNAVLTQSYPIGVRNEFINDYPVNLKVGFGRLLIVIER